MHEDGTLLTGKGQDEETVLAAWLYYIGNLSQQEVSDRLGISRFKVVRMLADARKQGLVRIAVEHRTAPTLELADKLCAAFNLREAQVAPVPVPTPDFEFERSAVGILAASYLVRIATGDAAHVIGIGWGRTLSAMADNVSGLVNRNLAFVSLTGSVSLATRTAPGDVCTRLATQTGGRAMLLPAPFVMDTPQACQTIVQQRLVRETLTVARGASHAIMSVGECRKGAILFEGGLFSPEQIDQLLNSGAVGDCCGTFFAADGQVLDIPVNHCTVSLQPDEMIGMDVTITAAGTSKTSATLAVLRAQFVDRLLVDESLARSLLQEA